ncbi:MAG: DUF6353 family protein [Anaeroplasma sp.]
MKFIDSVKTFACKAGFELKKHSPEILVGAGVVGVVTSTILACKATTKVDAILAEKAEEVEKIHRCQEDEELRQSGKYTEQDAKKDLTIVYTQTGVKLVKLYAPSVLLGVASLGAIIGSHVILNKRNVALAGAYYALSDSFKHYRENVRERFGKDVDFQLKNNIKTKVEETKTVQYIDTENHKIDNPYVRIFDETNPNWVRDADQNRIFLMQVQNHANDRLRIQGYLFLNDVYEMLGFPKTQTGQVVGWLCDSKHPENNHGDGYVDFGIMEIGDVDKSAFINGYEKSILLEFNVDGPILNKLPE